MLILDIFSIFLLFSDIKAKIIKFGTKFWVNQANFFPSKCTSLLLRSKPVRRSYLHTFKNFKTPCDLRFKGGTKLHTMHYLCLFINFFYTGLSKPVFSTYYLGKLVFRLSLFDVFSVFSKF